MTFFNIKIQILALGTPGTYSLGESVGALGINATIQLPSLNSAVCGILNGRWQGTVDFQSNGTIVASYISPSNKEYVDIDCVPNNK